MRETSLTPNFSDKTVRCLCIPRLHSSRSVLSEITGNSFPHVAMRNDLLFALLMILLAPPIVGGFVCNAAVQHVAAPEVQQKKLASFSSDMYSLGMTICAIYNQGRPLIQANHSCSDYLKQLETVS